MKALIDRRVDKMAEEGLLEEVQALLAMGLPRNATAMQAIGYKEMAAALLSHGDVSAGAEEGGEKPPPLFRFRHAAVLVLLDAFL